MELTQFFALLSKSSFAASLTTAGVILVFALIMVIISYYRKSPLTIGLGFLQFTFGTSKQDTPHTKCNEVAVFRFKHYISAKEKLIAKMYSEIIERQMSFCDDKINVISDMLMDDYRLLLSKKLTQSVDVKNHDCYRHYMMMVDLMLKECIKEATFKKSMKQNHLLDLKFDNWESFIGDKMSLTFSLMNRFYDDNYPETSLVTRTELDISNERLFDKIRPIIVSMYRRAREITVEVTDKIVIVQKEVDDECRSGNFEILCVDDSES
jgi:hypothetical protein